MKKLYIILIGTLLFVGCGDSGKKNKIKEARVKSVKVEEIYQSDIIKISSSSGIIEPANEIKRISTTGGIVSKINFKNGDRVKKGQMVLELHDQDVESNYLKAEALEKSGEIDYKIKKINFTKIESLYKKQLVSEDEYLNSKNAFNHAEATVKGNRASYLKAKDDYENLRFLAKEDGVITDLEVKMHEKIMPNTVVYTLVDDKNMLVKTYVSSDEIEDLKVGANAKLKVSGLKNELLGKVYEINPVAQKDSKKYQIKISLDNDDKKLRKGMYSDVSVESGKNFGYVVPKSSIVIKDLSSYIFVVDSDVVRRIKIDRGYSNGENQEIISDQLKEPLNIVIDGQFILEDRDTVKVLSEEV
ncbi:efflux RND transporter periplasmic adaptor subunit [Cetobacterium sp. 2A]|uniref:efflux RND transporter periplasmic adaptor subunit n=1 Tax=Cetobacterium sp. 2A TaxID=2754723 RepID=UPI00163CBEB6|nr:efflux RND transporter periplasmic adaptor subunit [Cetobacterium sp. 2A]MBC2856369.1 efflux RND transporter periplasmic adaptor subunit [Cetobacterium sp. 2A]